MNNNAELEYTALLKLKFTTIGAFLLNNDVLDFEITSDARGTGCYVFTGNDKVYYVGKTKNSIKRRLYPYKNPGPSQATNKRINSEIKRLLKQGKRINIMYINRSKIKNKNVKVEDLETSLSIDVLETFLIEGFAPKWNK